MWWLVSNVVLFGVLGITQADALPIGGGALRFARTPTYRIVGGDVVKADHGYTASLRFVKSSDGSIVSYCGGSLITSEWVLTAAHCVSKEYITSDDLWIGGLSTEKPEQFDIVKVTKWVCHPDFKSKNGVDNDICLLKLSKPSTKPTILLNYSPERELPGTHTIVTGFGPTVDDRQAPGSKVLRVADAPIRPDKDCTKPFGNKYMADVMICAGLKDASEDACYGDSGSAMVDDDGVQVGIVSWGFGCGVKGYYTVYVRMSAFHEWIENIVGSAVFAPPVGGNGTSTTAVSTTEAPASSSSKAGAKTTTSSKESANTTVAGDLLTTDSVNIETTESVMDPKTEEVSVPEIESTSPADTPIGPTTTEASPAETPADAETQEDTPTETPTDPATADDSPAETPAEPAETPAEPGTEVDSPTDTPMDTTADTITEVPIDTRIDTPDPTSVATSQATDAELPKETEDPLEPEGTASTTGTTNLSASEWADILDDGNMEEVVPEPDMSMVYDNPLSGFVGADLNITFFENCTVDTELDGCADLANQTSSASNVTASNSTQEGGFGASGGEDGYSFKTNMYAFRETQSLEQPLACYNNCVLFLGSSVLQRGHVIYQVRPHDLVGNDTSNYPLKMPEGGMTLVAVYDGPMNSSLRIHKRPGQANATEVVPLEVAHQGMGSVELEHFLGEGRYALDVFAPEGTAGSFLVWVGGLTAEEVQQRALTGNSTV